LSRHSLRSREDENPSLLFLVLSPHLVPSHSYEPRTKLLASERRTWAQRAGTDLPILSENGEPITDNRSCDLQLASCNLELMTKNLDAKSRDEELLLFLKMESLFFRRSLKCFDEPIYGGPDQLIKGCHVPRENVERMVRAFYKKNF